MKTVTVPNLSFRQLADMVAREGQTGRSPARRFTQLARICKLSRAQFYYGLDGNRRLSENLIAKITKGFSSIAPWVTETMVASALERTRALRDLD